MPQISWHERSPIYSLDIMMQQSSLTSDSSDIILVTCGSLQEQSALASLAQLEEPNNDINVDHSNKGLGPNYSNPINQSAARIHFWFVSFISDHTEIDNNTKSKSNQSYFQVKHLKEVTNDRGGFNCVRFSPNRKFMAAANDDSNIYIYSINYEIKQLNNVNSIQVSQIKILRGHLDGVYDISWSHDSKLLVSGSTDRSFILWDVSQGIYLRIYKNHKNMVLGTAFSPLCCNFASFSLDRTLKIYNNPKSSNYSQNFRSFDLHSHESSDKMPNKKTLGTITFLDDSFPSFFRRICYSPCGKIIFVPTATIEYPDKEPLPVTVIFSAADLSKPLAYLPSEMPSICVQCSPILYKPRPCANKQKNPIVFDIDYAIIFAVCSRDSITIYSTQFRHPLAHLSSLHYANINDIRWSSQGDSLVACSSDGYITFVHFERHLGELSEMKYDLQNPNTTTDTDVPITNDAMHNSNSNKNEPFYSCKSTQTESFAKK